MNRTRCTAGLVYTKIVFTILEATSCQAQNSHSYKHAHSRSSGLHTYTVLSIRKNIHIHTHWHRRRCSNRLSTVCAFMNFVFELWLWHTGILCAYDALVRMCNASCYSTMDNNHHSLFFSVYFVCLEIMNLPIRQTNIRRTRKYTHARINYIDFPFWSALLSVFLHTRIHLQLFSMF